MSPTYKPLAGQFRAARIARGLSQEQVAVRAGLCSHTVRKIECGRLSSVRSLNKLGGVLGVALALAPLDGEAL